MNQNTIAKPKKRSKLRSFLGKEYFITRRRLKWLFGKEKYAKQNINTTLPYPIIKHQSLLLRPLKDVDMIFQHNKITNLRLATKKINHVIIKPKETFSIWKMVGRPTKRKGYLEGLVLHNGKIHSGIGGGLCQLGNLLYWMTLHTPLQIKERWRHSFDVFPDINRTIPFACGATLSFNYIDLQLYNHTNNTYQINLWLDDTHLHGAIFCNEKPTEEYEIFETDHHFQQQIWGGYTRHNKIWKKKTCLISKKVENELVSNNTAIMMYSPLLNK